MIMLVVLLCITLGGGGGKDDGKYIICLPIVHLDSQFLISKLADALPLLLVFVVVR